LNDEKMNFSFFRQLIAASCVVYYGDMARVVLHDSRVHRLFLRLAYVGMAGVFSGVFYMAAWVSFK